MAGIRFTRLVDNFVAHLELGGSTVIRTRVTDSERPARIRVVTADRTIDCLLFLWTITPGGGGPDVRPASERRIQRTNADRITVAPGVRTLLGGWNVEAGVYAFWDARRHLQGSKNSPSLQVNSVTLENAGSLGIATQLRPTAEGQEVVVAVAPSSLNWYVENGMMLHNADADATAVEELITATPEVERNFIDTSETEAQIARRYDLVETMRAYRDAKFKPAVLQAYNHKCAICNCDLKLVDAAHILPVSHPSSTDEVDNGLALCRLHHGAYDNALLGIQSNLDVVINNVMLDKLIGLNLGTSISQFRASLPKKARVPTVIEARPKPKYLKLGLEIRGFPQALIV